MISVIDAMGKLPEGILAGNVFALGDYNTCLDVKAPEFQLDGSTIEGFRSSTY